MSFIDACRTFISLDTTPAAGSRLAAEWLADYCRKKNLRVELQHETFADKEEANIIIRPQAPQQGADFLLQGHLDTVEPGPFHLWQKTDYNPFSAVIQDGAIYGLGAAEVKLDLLCKIEALARFNQHSGFKLDPVVVGTFGEETGMQGALRLIRKNKVAPKMAVISEPSNLGVIHAAKGVAHVEILVPFSAAELEHRKSHDLSDSTSTQSKMFKGKATHSSIPQYGESAISKALDYLQQLPSSLSIMEFDGGTSFNSVPAHAFLEMDFFTQQDRSIAERITEIYKSIKALQDQLRQHQDERFSPSHSTLNIGVIRTFADHIYLAGTVRMLPSITQEVYEQWMQVIQKSCESQGAHFRVVDYKKPFYTPEHSILAKAALDTLSGLSVSSQLMSQSSTNEASLFSRIGVECICFGPGQREENIHTPMEHVRLKDLEISREFYSRLIERICL